MQDGASTRWWREQSKDATGLCVLRLGGYAGPSELDGAVVHANQVDCLRALGTHQPAHRRSGVVLVAFLPCVREG
jgi:hypothetical protein